MFNIGIIGCGKIAQVRHIPEYAAHPAARLAGYYDLNQERAQALAEQWGLEIKNWCRRITARHIFTHVEWHMTGYVLRVRGRGPEDFVWAREEELASSLAVPSAFARFLAEAREELQGQQ